MCIENRVEGLDPIKMSAEIELGALDRLIRIAQSDTHQSRRVADFLLAWWNADAFGGFDLTSLWNLDGAIQRDMSIVFGLIGRSQSYPNAWGYGEVMRGLVDQWRSVPN